MRGAARIGGRAFRPTPSSTPRNGFNPLEALDLIGDLPVAPVLEPINDEWSWSLGAEPADPRDCTRYPASPYCGEIPFELGKPFGVTPELKTNGCETCLYVYPVILWLKATPQVICRRDPNCEKKAPPKIPTSRPDPYDENTKPNSKQSPECAERINRIHKRVNQINAGFCSENERNYLYNISLSNPDNIKDMKPYSTIWDIPDLRGILVEGDIFTANGMFGLTYEGVWYREPPLENIGIGIPAGLGYFYISFTPGHCPDKKRPAPILPPPPVPPLKDGIPKNDIPQNRRRRGKDMCCNDCADSKDNTEKLLKELKEIKKVLGTGKLEKALNAAVGIGDGDLTTIVNLLAKRLGTSAYPIEVPESLLTGVDDGKTFKAESNAEYLFWLTKQLDGLVGEFPIQIEVKDIDPLTKGDQTQKIEIPNLAEAIAEIYGLVAKGAVNQEVDQAFLLRIATEVIAAKNGIAITQDYVKANAKFLGYKGNPVDREMQYNFDFSKIVLGQKDQDVKVDEILQTVKGYVKGWENQDKETAADFFMKLMFSAGIIKSVFFRNKKQMAEVIDKADEMLKDRLKVEDNWKEFLRDVNNPASQINKNQAQPPDIKEENP